MYYLNSSGKDVSFTFNGVKYSILCWDRAEFPDEVYDYVESSVPQIEVDYEMHIAMSQGEIAFARQWSEFKDPNIQLERIAQWP